MSSHSSLIRRGAAAALMVGAVAFGSIDASAASSREGLLLSLPAANAEATSAAAVVSEQPFQKFVVLSCKGDAGINFCRARLPAVAPGERLVIQFTSCIVQTAEGGEIGNIHLAVTDATATRLLAGHVVAPTFRGGAVATIHAASQPMLLTVDGSRVLHLEATPSGGTITLARCGLSGVRQRLR